MSFSTTRRSFTQAYAIMKTMIVSLLALTALLDAWVLAKLVYAFRLLTFPRQDLTPGDELPTVSVCITARNETHAMTQCLERVVASDYPKLEVIVLDDGSRDDTSILIKSFAHAGVRFVEGKPLPDGWLGKNYAQSVLADEASGKYVFYMDVDTLVDRFTVQRAVNYMLHHNAKMISIVPIRNDHWQTSTLMTTMRHFWTVMRFRPSRPRAAANAWIVNRELLVNELATDMNLPTSMQMETTIARKLAATREYRLVMSNKWLGLSYEKRWVSQLETSIRLLYPQCSKHIYNAIGLILLLFLALVPYALIILQPWAFALIAVQYGIGYYYLAHVWSRYRLIGALLLPITLIQESILIVVSVYRYNFGVITWKGRPITTKQIN